MSTISISSRHSIKSEYAEMSAFVVAAEEAQLDMFVADAYYDSVSQCCSFAFKMDLQPGEGAAEELLAIAQRTIRQFEWFGVTHHGQIE